TLDSPAVAAGKPDHAGKSGQAGKPDRADKADHVDKPAKRSDRPAAGGIAITGAAAALIERYERTAGHPRPEALPPGIARNLARGKPLPPGIAKKQLPASLLGQLPHYEGHRYYSVGRDVVLISEASQRVVDILVGAL
ncbi:MAG: anti-virulence regulator CigR family protein, partial [Tistlia sp.]